jgi:hypothetical protein
MKNVVLVGAAMMKSRAFRGALSLLKIPLVGKCSTCCYIAERFSVGKRLHRRQQRASVEQCVHRGESGRPFRLKPSIS